MFYRIIWLMIVVFVFYYFLFWTYTYVQLLRFLSNNKYLLFVQKSLLP